MRTRCGRCRTLSSTRDVRCPRCGAERRGFTMGAEVWVWRNPRNKTQPWLVKFDGQRARAYTNRKTRDIFAPFRRGYSTWRNYFEDRIWKIVPAREGNPKYVVVHYHKPLNVTDGQIRVMLRGVDRTQLFRGKSGVWMAWMGIEKDRVRRIASEMRDLE